MRAYGIILISLVADLVRSLQSERLNEHISHFEPVLDLIVGPYPLVHGHAQQHRYVSFRAFDREFDLNLTVESTFLTDKTVIVSRKENATERIPVSKTLQWLVEGAIDNENDSYVIGRLYRGQFEGLIRSGNETYYMEEAKRYFHHPTQFRSVVYKKTDVNATLALCGKRNLCPKFSTRYGPLFPVNRSEEGSRLRRDLISYHTNVCLLGIFVDHTFFQRATDRTTDMVILEVILLIAEVQKVFDSVVLDESNEEKIYVKFIVSSIEIFYSKNSVNYYMYNESMTAEDFAKAFSQYELDDYCLAVAITHRSFPHRSMGTAFQAEMDPRRAGGMCQQRRRAFGSMNSKNFNIVAISVSSPNKEIIPRALSGLILAHEMGHAFGSTHDDPKDAKCSPPKESGGSYVMSPYILDMSESNNNKFSPCSRTQIQQQVKLKGTCFTRQTAICGNAIIEEGEECDCGRDFQCDDIDFCCVPLGGRGSDEQCRLRLSEGRVCSPRASPCCSKRCQLIPFHEEKDCSSGNDCLYPARCTGYSPECPAANPRPDGSSCRNGLGRCMGGQCFDYVCSQRNLVVCTCLDYRIECQLCCRAKNQLHCKPATAFGMMSPLGHPLLLPPGEKCHDGKGRCNVAGQCVIEFGTPRKIMRAEESTESSREDRELENETYARSFELLTILLISVVSVAIVGVTLVALFLFSPFGTVGDVWRT